jgi:methylamine---glutamate N-methyltransferase subunit C
MSFGALSEEAKTALANCPSGIATQKEELRAKLNIEESAARRARFLTASVELMKVMARTCGHTQLNQFNVNDITI